MRSPVSCSSNYNPLFYFPYNINGTPCDMVFTSVAGHLMELDFTESHKKWHSCSPLDLYGAPVTKTVPAVWLCAHLQVHLLHVPCPAIGLFT